ncbi:Endonuclease/exonuclease/phosphatase [Syncephalis fuscata]|nr:Endonuclease/exonuclease/phosphatase [Syncephalis fuscata]
MTMAYPPLHILTATYNLHQQPIPSDITQWLGQQLKENSSTTTDSSIVVPDLVAVAFQEFAPYPEAFLSTPHETLIECDEAIRCALNHWTNVEHGSGKETVDTCDNNSKVMETSKQGVYEQIAVHTLVGMALFVYIRRAAPFAATSIITTDVGCGVGWAGNKGAVGIYCRLYWHRVTDNADNSFGVFKDEYAEQIELTKMADEHSFTTEIGFVCAHLMAHAWQVERRNQELQMIMERLVFEPLAQSLRNDKNSNYNQQSYMSKTRTLLELPLVFLMGDLNYRVTPQGGSDNNNVAWSCDVARRIQKALLHQISKISPIDNDVESLLELRNTCDQLIVACQQNTAHSLSKFQEPECHFPPTYKFKLNSDQYAVEQRTPSWCDRILYYVYGETGDADKPSTPTVTNLYYKACFKYCQSDHRPVVALFRVDIARLKYITHQVEEAVAAAPASSKSTSVGTNKVHPLSEDMEKSL